MTSLEPGTPEAASDRGKAPSHTGLWIASGALIVLLLALATWLVVDQARTDEASVPAEIEQLLDEYAEAWEEGDEAALRAITGRSYHKEWFVYETVYDRLSTLVLHMDHDIDGAITGYITSGWTIERLGAMTFEGDDSGPWFVSVPERWTGAGSYGHSGISLYVIVEEDGQLRIANDLFAGDRSRPTDRAEPTS